MTEGMMRAWLVTPVALAVVRVPVLRCGAAVAGDGDGQDTYASAQASGA